MLILFNYESLIYVTFCEVGISRNLETTLDHFFIYQIKLMKGMIK